MCIILIPEVGIATSGIKFLISVFWDENINEEAFSEVNRKDRFRVMHPVLQ